MSKKYTLIFFILFVSFSLEAKKSFFDKVKNLSKKAGNQLESASDSTGNWMQTASVTTGDAIQTFKNDPKGTTQDVVQKSLDGAEYLVDTIDDLSFDYVKKQLRDNYPFTPTLTDEQLKVRQSIDLCSQEEQFLINRKPKVHKALNQYFEIKNSSQDDILRIGISCSGGGNRAMLVATGFLLGAEDIGLYQSSLYLAGLSGGSWTVTPFSYCNSQYNMTLTEFKDQLIPRLGTLMEKVKGADYKGIPVFSKDEQDDIDRNLIKRFSYGQYVSSIDMYGSFIGDYTLLPAEKTPDDNKNNRRFKVLWSSIADKIIQGNMPLPMGSAVAMKGSDDGYSSYYWFEVGPFEVGSEQLKSYVPVQGFGAKYKQGHVVDGYAGHTPEYPMSFYEGVFGSAFTLGFNEVIDHMGKTKVNIAGKDYVLPLSNWFDGSKEGSGMLEGMRISPATFHNYTYQVEGLPEHKEEKIKLFDGGMNFNSPLPLIMRQARQVDVVVLCDAMEYDLDSLKLAAIHFKRNNIKFPDLSGYKPEDLYKPLTVFNDPRSDTYDKDTVTILYCPFAVNKTCMPDFDPATCRQKEYCQVLNFNYTPEQAKTVVDLMRCNVNSIKDTVKEVLKKLQDLKLQKIAAAKKTV